jgi:ketosteroid isomerase-like protein
MKIKLADDDKAAVTQLLTDYYSAFSTLDAQAVLPYFHEPSQLVSPAGVLPTPTRAAVAAAFQPVMDALRTRGFAKSELTKQRTATEWQFATVVIHDADDALRPE